VSPGERPAYPLRAAFAGVLLFAIGVAIGVTLLRTHLQDRERLRDWSRADGTVVELLKRRSVEGEVTVPLIAFTTPSGDRVSFTAGADVKGSAVYVNAPVKVLYRAANPQEALIDTPSRRWVRNGLGAMAAIILMALGGYVAWYASRWDTIAPPTT
jgi:hypothetical protein